MNRIEEAIQRAKVAKAVRDREAARTGEGPRVQPFPRRERPADGLDPEPPRDPGGSAPPQARTHTQSHASPPPVPTPPSRPPSPSDAAATAAQPAPAAARLELDSAALESLGLWPDAEHARRIGDEFRLAKRAVLAQFQRTPEAPRVLAVTSALAGEGKSFSSLHLALCMALERGTSVLLVDTDAPHPTLTGALGCAGDVGLLDCLERGVRLDAAMRPTNFDRLWFLPVGAAEHGASELLSSPQARELLATARQRLRDPVVVLDTAPLLLTVEGRAATDLATQTLLVVEAGATPEGAILQALDDLGPERCVQLLLNRHRPSRFDAARYYYAYPADTAGDHATAAR